VDSGKSVLFPPRLHADYAIWQGKIEPEDYFKKKYEVDEVHFNDENTIRDALKTLKAQKLLLLHADNTDSGNWLEPANFKGKDEFSVDTNLLYPIIAELRVFKTDAELEVLRYASKIASDAHKEVMRHIKPEMYEYQLESLFRHISHYTGGCRHLSYTCIAASGPNAAVLHYGHANAPNDKLIKDGDICLFDMGPEYNCYASDVTCSFPANGKFTEKQKVVYNAVLKANEEVFAAAKPGVRWTDMHILAEKVVLTHLKEAGVLLGDVNEMLEKRIGAVFMPHGLGHFMGLDVHDCGGYLGDATPRSTLPGLKSLRTTRTLQERMVITIEPGCYFIDTLLDRALADKETAKYFNQDVLKKYRGIGGVRIEDDVIIWAKGNENMSQVPRTVEEIERFMAAH
jgi:Xaa-Pro dipeptidase